MSKSWLRGCRLILGIIFLVFGVNGFYTFIPVPKMAPAAEEFMSALINTGYMLYFWKSIEVVSGVMLITNRFVFLATLILLPITANIFLFHLFLDPKNLLIGFFVLTANLAILYSFKEKIKFFVK